MQKTIPIITAAIILSAGTTCYWLYNQEHPTEKILVNKEKQRPADSYHQLPNHHLAKPDNSKVDELNQLIDSFNELAQTMDAPLQDTQPLAVTLWTPTDQPYPEDFLSLPEEVSDKTPINLDPKELDVIATGDSISFSLPGNYQFDAVVKKTTYSRNGDKTLIGHLDGATSPDGDAYPVILTLGSNTTFATILTPYGSYSMETINGQGWIYKNPPRSILETAETDVVIPDDSALQH